MSVVHCEVCQNLVDLDEEVEHMEICIAEKHEQHEVGACFTCKDGL